MEIRLFTVIGLAAFHWAAATALFARLYGNCVLAFIEGNLTRIDAATATSFAPVTTGDLASLFQLVALRRGARTALRIECPRAWPKPQVRFSGQSSCSPLCRTVPLHSGVCEGNGSAPRQRRVSVEAIGGKLTHPLDLPRRRAYQETSSITSSLPLNDIVSPARLPANSA